MPTSPAWPSTSAPAASLPSMHQKHCFPAPSLPDPGLHKAASHTPDTGQAQSTHTQTRTGGNIHPCKEPPRCAKVGATSPASKRLRPVTELGATELGSLQHRINLENLPPVPLLPTAWGSGGASDPLPAAREHLGLKARPALAPGPYDSPNASFRGAQH